MQHPSWAGSHIGWEPFPSSASIAEFYPMPYVAPYSATKFAVVGLSENLALELEGTNIGVIVLCPSMVRTRIHESQRNNPTGPALSERWKARLDQIGAAVQAGIEPEVVAARALDAIRRKQFYIFTHPESRAKIEGRIQTILNSF